MDIARVDLATALAQRDRYRRLLPQGLVSGRDMELAEQKYNETDQKLQKAELDRKSAEIDVQAKSAKLEEVKSKTLADIAKIEADIQAAEAKVADYRKELLETESKIRGQRTQEVRAPRDGTIQRLLVNVGVQQVKDGDPIAILVPDAQDLAVEVFLDGNDLPLVGLGDPVRLQFEGWPAVQFVGWPSVAIGSFGGKVALIDPGDSGTGKFRILVTPDDKSGWPSNRYLRQGVRAKGWVLLRQVRLGYEVWRRLNGFPPVVASKEPDDAKGKDDASSYPITTDDKEKIKAKRPK